MPGYDLDDIKAIPLADVAAHLNLDHKGKRFFCPACQPAGAREHKTPDLSIEKKNHWKCFKCGAGGSVIDLVKQAEGKDFTGAVDFLGDAFHLQKRPGKGRPTGRPASRSSLTRRSAASKKTVSPAWTLQAFDSIIYKRILENTPIPATAVLHLMNTRGLTADVIHRYELGHVIEGHQACQGLLDQLRFEFSDDHLLHAGVCKRDKPEDPVRFAWWDRTMLIPYLDGDRVIYLQGRRVEGAPKYVNLAGPPRPVFNLAAAQAAPTLDNIYICEGVFDALAIIADGAAAVAVGGTSTTNIEPLRPLKDHPIFIARQNDAPSQTWARDLTKAFADIGKRDVRSLVIPEEFKDICDYLAAQGKRKITT